MKTQTSCVTEKRAYVKTLLIGCVPSLLPIFLSPLLYLLLTLCSVGPYLYTHTQTNQKQLLPRTKSRISQVHPVYNILQCFLCFLQLFFSHLNVFTPDICNPLFQQSQLKGGCYGEKGKYSHGVCRKVYQLLSALVLYYIPKVLSECHWHHYLVHQQ